MIALTTCKSMVAFHTLVAAYCVANTHCPDNFANIESTADVYDAAVFSAIVYKDNR